LFLSERNQFDNQVITRALLAAKGRYVALLEGDDYWTNTNKLQRQVDFLDENQEHAICFHDVQIIYEAGFDEQIDRLNRFRRPRPASTTTLRELLQEGYFKFHECSMMLRNGLLTKYPDWFNRAVYSGDWALTVLYAEHGTIGYIDEVMATYRIHPNGIWSSLGYIERMQRIIQFHENIKGHFSTTYLPLIKRNLARYWYFLATAQEALGHRTCARSSVKRGLAERPFHPRLLIFRYTPWLWGLLKSAGAHSLIAAGWGISGRR
jgi:hypothetical protein